MDESNLRDLILAQVAAESYLDGLNSDTYPLDRALKAGNNNSRNPYFSSVLPEAYPGNTRMTDRQIDRFSELYEIVHHQANTWTGFSGTLLKNTETSQYVLAFRSTEWANESQGGDWRRDGVADTEIGALGFAVAQIADAEAYFRKLRGEGLLPADANFRVTGYSLGGHLATVFAEAHADDPRLLEAVTFNGPGRGRLASGKVVKDLVEKAYSTFAANNVLLKSGDIGSIYATRFYAGDDTSPGLRAEVLAGFGTVGTSFFKSPTANLANNKITQVVGMADFDDPTLVANSGVHSSNYLNVFIEDQPNVQGLVLAPSWLETITGIRSDFGTTHSITLIADTVETGTLLQRIDGTLTQSSINAVLSTGSNARGLATLFSSGEAESDSLENIVEALAVLYGADLSAFSDEGRIRHGQRGGEFGDLNNRNGFFQAIRAVSDRVSAESIGTIRSFIGFNAETLSGIAKEDSDAGLSYRYALVAGNGFVVQASRSLYADPAKGLNSGGRLDRFQSTLNPGALSDRYLDDRAAFVERKTYFNLNNARYDLTAPSTNPGNRGDSIATDYDGENIAWSDLGSGISVKRAPPSSSTQYRLFGGEAADVLLGGAARDALYGAAGSDVLEAGGGSDYLEGGTGLDTYRFTSGDGVDVVLDVDGKGELVRNGVVLSLGVRESGEDAWHLGVIQYTRSGNSLVMTFDGTGDSITIENFDFEAAGSDGYLGIRLRDFGVTQSQRSEATHPFEGDRWALGTYIDNLGNWQFPDPVLDEFGNYVRDSLLPPRTIEDGFTGSPEDDAIYGHSRNDVLRGEKGDDALYGGTGDDVLYGGIGDDALYGDQESDDELFEAPPRLAFGFELFDDGVVHYMGELFDGPPEFEGAGDDRIYGDEGADLIYGEAGADELHGGDGNDVISGGGSSGAEDRLYGGSGDDRLFAGDVQELEEALTQVGSVPESSRGAILFGEDGDDILVGADQADTLSGGEGFDLLLGGDGDDFLQGDADDDYLAGGTGADDLEGGAGSDVLVGGEGDDLLIGGAGDDVIEAGDGNDMIHLNGADVVWAGAGDDSVEWEEAEALAPWTLFLEAGDDTVEASDGDDYVDGGEGADFLFGNGGNDVLLGDEGDDFLDGGTGNNTLSGGEGNDSLSAEDGDDVMLGGAGDDFLIAGAGNDHLAGGIGDDFIDGGMGDDSVEFTLGDGADTILDTGVAGTDTLSFGDGISPGDVAVVVDPDSTTLSITGTEDRVVLLHGAHGEPGIERIVFADGTAWDARVLYTGYVSPLPAGPTDVPETTPDDTGSDAGSIADDSVEEVSSPTPTPLTDTAAFAEAPQNDTITVPAAVPPQAENILGGDSAPVLPFGVGSPGEVLRNEEVTALAKEDGMASETSQNEPDSVAAWYAAEDSAANLPFVSNVTDEPEVAKPLESRPSQPTELVGLTSWEITNALLQFHLAFADDSELGADLTNPFGRNDFASGVSITAAQQMIGAAGFGAEAQTLQLFTGLQEGFATLS